MSNATENTKGLSNNEDLEEDDIPDQTPGATSNDVEPVVLETTAWQDIKNGASGVWTGIKKGTAGLWHNHKGKIIGGAIGAAIVYDKVVKPLKEAHKANDNVDTIETTETPLLEVEPEPDVEEIRDIYIINEETGDYDFVKTCTLDEAEAIKESLLNDDVTDDEVSTENVGPETETTE